MKTLKFTTLAAAFLSLFVVMLGAFTRLSDAGLGCPDWPGCYGQLVLSQYSGFQKGWIEMAHRYAAGSLVLLVTFICIYVWFNNISKKFSIFLISLLLFQAALGMWTVTLKLLPIVVMSHLLGGITIFASLCYLYLKLTNLPRYDLPQWRNWIYFAIILVFLQIALGGWVSSNYAGLACIGFPQCNGLWFPTLHLAKGFNLFSPLRPNYQGGILLPEIRVTIQFIHRLGALVVTMYLLTLIIFLFKEKHKKYLNKMAVLLLLFIVLQFSLGIANVIYLLPLKVAVFHNGVAAILFATVVCLKYFVGKENV